MKLYKNFGRNAIAGDNYEMGKSKKKTLTINIILFSISSFGTKFLALFLTPLYTNYLTTAEYGTIDLIVNTASLLLPIFTFCIEESVIRYTLDDKDNCVYFKVGICVDIVGGIVLAFVLFVGSFISQDMINVSYLKWVWALFAGHAVYNTLTYYARAVEKVKYMVMASILNSLVMLSLNILLITKFALGIEGYLISTTCGLVLSAAYIWLRSQPLKSSCIVREGKIKDLTKGMLQYSSPWIFNSIAWWINSSLDRYFVTALCGVDANGVYSIAYKIPNMLTAVQTIFTQAWGISAVKEFDSEDKDGFMGQTYELLSMVMLLACSAIMVINEPISKFLYAKEFYEATYYVPLLLVATFFGAMAGFYGGIFAAVKDSKICAISTVVGAIINAILNAILIPFWGIYGAAIATVIAYFFSWLIRSLSARKYIKMKINRIKIYSSYGLIVLQMICASTSDRCYAIQLILIVLFIMLYMKDIMFIATCTLKKIKSLFGCM